MKALLYSFLFWAACCFVHAAHGFDHEFNALSGKPTVDDVHLLLEKTGQYMDSNEDGEFSTGDTVFYSFVVKNVCSGTISDIMVKDPAATLQGTPITLAPGEEDHSTFSAFYVLTQQDVDAGVFKNTATVSGQLPSGEVVSAEDEDIQDIYVKGSIKLEKTGTYEDTNGDGQPSVGDHVHYHFTVKNSCHATLYEVVVLDALVEISGGPITLAPGEKDKTTFSGSYALTQADIDAGTLVNTATAIGRNAHGESVKDSDEDVQDIYVKGSIKLEKTGTYVDTNEDGLPNVGDHVRYTFVVKNSCHVTLTDVVVTDPLVEVTGGPITLVPGEKDKTTFSAVYALTQGDIDAGMLINEAVAKGINPHGEAIVDKDDDKQVFEVSGAIKLKKTGEYHDTNGDGFASPGDEIRYTFEVKNSCHVTLRNVHILDTLVEVTGGPITLAPGQKDKTTFKATYTLTQADIDQGKVTNKATAVGENPKGEPITDCDTHTVILQGLGQPIGFDLTKEVDITRAVLGQQLTYTISLTNTSPVEVKDIRLLDPLPEELTYVSSTLPRGADGGWEIAAMAPGEQLVVELSVMATQVGEVVNIVELTADDYQTQAEAEAVVIRECNVDLAISKTSHGAKIYQGDEFSYTLTVQNNGEDTATDVVITDVLPDLVSYVSSAYVPSSEDIVPQLQQEGSTLRWEIAHFPPGESVEIALTVKANGLGELLNEALVESPHEEENPDDNADKDWNTIVEFFIPNVFTPGTKDNINDSFVIRGLQQFRQNNIVIMNRLGDHVFEKENYQNDWDAKGLNGGAYFYVLSVTDTQGAHHVFKGWVQVIKGTTSNQTER